MYVFMFLKRQQSVLLMLLVFNASSYNEVRKCTLFELLKIFFPTEFFLIIPVFSLE